MSLMATKSTMTKSKKPYPGMGRWVVLLRYGDTWVVHCGANTREKAQAERRKLPQWRDADVRVVENDVPRDNFTTTVDAAAAYERMHGQL